MTEYGFRNIVGNTATIRILKRALENNRFPQLSLFTGTFGTGKSTNAKNVAMSLTCENPSGGEACMNCATCRANLRAFETTGESHSVKIVNLGKFARKDDVNNLIKDVFVLQSGLANKVYIFEEVHALSSIPGAQTAFLEEIDRMPPNTYVIMCTTEERGVLSALKSRALQFTFSRLSATESRLLLEREAVRKRDTAGKGVLPDPQVLELIVANSKGVPRDLVKALDFALDNSVTKSELLELFHKISSGKILELIQSMYSTDMSMMIQVVSELFSNNPQDVVASLKDFVIRAMFAVEGDEKEGFTNDEYLQVLDLFSKNDDIYTIARSLEKIDSRASEEDVKLSLFNVRLALQKRSLTSVVTDRSKVAASETVHAREMAQEMNSFTQQSDNRLTKLSTGCLNRFFEESK